MGKTCGLIGQSLETLPWRHSSWLEFDLAVGTVGNRLLIRNIYTLNTQLGYDKFIVPLDGGLSYEFLVEIWLHNLWKKTQNLPPAQVEYLAWEGAMDMWPRKKKEDYLFQITKLKCEPVRLKRPESAKDWTARDAYLKKHCDCLLAVWDHSPDPVAKTIAAAQEAGVKISIIDWRR